MLRAIRDRLKGLENKYPVREDAYVCVKCRDTGFATLEDDADRVFTQPCDRCEAGEEMSRLKRPAADPPPVAQPNPRPQREMWWDK